MGYGKAEKRQVMDMTKRLLNLKAVPKPDDAADAVAIALCTPARTPPGSSAPMPIGRAAAGTPYARIRSNTIMFYYVKGTVAHTAPYLAVIDCGGVGYACRTTNNTLSRLKKGRAPSCSPT